MSIEDRRQAVKEMAGQGMSNVAIGEVLGVDEGTVRNAKRSENSEVDGDEVSNDAVASSENSEPLSTVAVLAADDKIRNAARLAERRSCGSPPPYEGVAFPRPLGYPSPTAHQNAL